MRSFKILLKILKTAAVFLLTVSLLSAFFIECYLRGENYHYQDGRERDALSGQITFLICGASYTLFGIQPDVISAKKAVNCYSIAGTMMTLRARYTLLQYELERNPEIYCILLEVSPDTLLRDREEEGAAVDLPMLGRLNDSAARWDYFREAFTVDEWPEVYYDLVSKGIESAFLLLTGRYETENQIMVSGYYENRNPDKYIPDNYRNIFRAQSLPETINEENVVWLEKIVELCKEKHRAVYLITTPQSKYYNCINANLDFFQSWFDDFAAAHDVPYFNFNLEKSKLTKLPDKGCFYDETHLNTAGSEIFTGLLLSVINAVRRGEDVSYRFYRSYDELTWASHYSQGAD